MTHDSSVLTPKYMIYFFDDFFVIRRIHLEECLVIQRTLVPSSIEERSATNRPYKITISKRKLSSLPLQYGRYIPFYGLYGIYWLLHGPYLALITKIHEDDILNIKMHEEEHVIYKIKQIEYVLITSNIVSNNGNESAKNVQDAMMKQRRKDEEYLALLDSIVQMGGFYFSFTYDLTNSLQRIVTSKTKENEKNTNSIDERFVWNYSASSLFFQNKLWNWIAPVIHGFISVTDNCQVNENSFTLFYISRRSRHRQGMRFTMRGIDKEGHVANFAETEQICIFNTGRISSFVQIRGSIPVFWSSPPSMKYAPRVYKAKDVRDNMEAYRLHMDETVNIYGRILMVCLVDKKSQELKLGQLFEDTVHEAASENAHYGACVRFVWFDFHKECRKMKYENLGHLVRIVDDDFHDYGYFAIDNKGQIERLQSGVLRTNCMDNLDRTNVVQSVFARRNFLLQTNDLDSLRGNILQSPYKQFEQIFRGTWVDNANALSIFYSGTGALKTDFTRTGKRTRKGALEDGKNSLVRYYKNNFCDGIRQDALDLFLQRYLPTSSKPSPFQRRLLSSPLKRICYELIYLSLIIYGIEVFRNTNSSFFTKLIVSWITTFLIVIVLFILVLKNGFEPLGRRYVCLPKFCPQAGCNYYQSNGKRKED